MRQSAGSFWATSVRANSERGQCLSRKSTERRSLRRGFTLIPDDRVLVVEDVVTTGQSVHEIFEVVRVTGAQAIALAIIVRRAPVPFDVPALALLDLPIESFAPDVCPQCAAGVPLSEPGSRFLR